MANVEIRGWTTPSVQIKRRAFFLCVQYCLQITVSEEEATAEPRMQILTDNLLKTLQKCVIYYFTTKLIPASGNG